jgi:hypothetical protein
MMNGKIKKYKPKKIRQLIVLLLSLLTLNNPIIPVADMKISSLLFESHFQCHPLALV